MDLPRPSLVKQLKLHLSPEGRGFAYLLADRASGGILRLSRTAALAYDRFSRATLGDPAARSQMVEEDAKLGFMSLSMAEQMRKSVDKGPKAFNPLSIHLDLVDVGPWQRRLHGLARAAFSRWALGALAAMTLLAILFGLRNDWSAATAFRDSMTLQAFVTFGFLAPFLKLIHELGHVLACTRYGVRVRQGGVNIIGFYPMPFVDCSEADLIAQRRHRIMISAAGVLTDFTVGLLAFLVWHITDSGQARDIMGYVFVFSTLNSLLFNMNPLMRMDGYFAVSDALGRRNLGADASQVMKAALTYVKTFGAAGALPGPRADWLLLIYSLAASVYRVLVLVGILWLALPMFFGVGVLAAVWSAYAMFGDKLFQPRPPMAAQGAPDKVLRRRVIWAAIGAFGLGLLFVPIAPRVVVDVKPDLQKEYGVTNPRPGVVTWIVAADVVLHKGDRIAVLNNVDIDDAVALSDLATKEAAIINAIAQGAGAAEIKAGAEQLANATSLAQIADEEFAGLTLRANRTGRFTVTHPVVLGSYLSQGSLIGQILPQDGSLILTGAFPENYVAFFETGLAGADLWTGSDYRAIATQQVALVQEVQQDATTQSRGFTLRLATDAQGLGPFPQLRLHFRPIPIWRHIAFWGQEKLAQFRDAQLAEKERRIEN